MLDFLEMENIVDRGKCGIKIKVYMRENLPIIKKRGKGKKFNLMAPNTMEPSNLIISLVVENYNIKMENNTMENSNTINLMVKEISLFKVNGLMESFMKYRIVIYKKTELYIFNFFSYNILFFLKIVR